MRSALLIPVVVAACATDPVGPPPTERGTFTAVLTGRLTGVVTGTATLIDGSSVGVPFVVLRLSTGFRTSEISMMLLAVPVPPGRPEGGQLEVFSQVGYGSTGFEPGVMAVANIARPGGPAAAYAVVGGAFEIEEGEGGDLIGRFHVNAAQLRAVMPDRPDVTLTGEFHARASMQIEFGAPQ